MQEVALPTIDHHAARNWQPRKPGRLPVDSRRPTRGTGPQYRSILEIIRTTRQGAGHGHVLTFLEAPPSLVWLHFSRLHARLLSHHDIYLLASGMRAVRSESCWLNRGNPMNSSHKYPTIYRCRIARPLVEYTDVKQIDLGDMKPTYSQTISSCNHGCSRPCACTI